MNKFFPLRGLDEADAACTPTRSLPGIGLGTVTCTCGPLSAAPRLQIHTTSSAEVAPAEMEDSVEVLLQDFSVSRGTDHPLVSLCSLALLSGSYGLWSMFALPGLRTVPWRLKVPYLPSSPQQTMNVLHQLRGRSGRLADLGSGDGRLVMAASSAGFQCTGFEINSVLVSFARAKARWSGLPSSRVCFKKADFWKSDLSSYNNVTAFLAPGAMEALGEKLLKELPDGSLLVSCRFPVPNWSPKSSCGSGLDQTWAYDISAVRARLDSERLDSERLDSERLDSERLDSERLDSERLDSERLDSERLDSERLDSDWTLRQSEGRGKSLQSNRKMKLVIKNCTDIIEKRVMSQVFLFKFSEYTVSLVCPSCLSLVSLWSVPPVLPVSL